MQLKQLPLTILLCFCAMGMAWAQHNPLATEYYQAGESALLQKDYKKALRRFQQAVELQPELMAAERGIGLCYEMLKEYPTALTHYLKIVETAPKFSRALYYQIGEIYFKLGLYNKAIAYFDQFRRMQLMEDISFTVNGEKERVLEDQFLDKLEGNIRACQISMDTSKFNQNVRIANLGSGINGRSDDYFPFLSNNQELLFFTRRRNMESDENLFFSTSQNGYWHEARPVNNLLNSNFNEGMSTLVRNGRHMYFTACNRPEVRGPCDIWEADLEKEEIKRVAALQGNPNTDQWESQAAISCDGSTLFFASNRPEGQGGTDIWTSNKLPGGEWSNPVNLGPQINTPLDEEAPFISNDGTALYFSSTGHLGIGDQDIFVSFKDQHGNWTTPMNLGPKINTPHRELGFYLSADGKTGYFASDRPGGWGGMDIYRVELYEELYSQPITYTEFQVRNSRTAEPIATRVVFGDDRQPLHTDSSGRFFLCLPANSHIRIKIDAPEFHPFNSEFPIPEWDNRQFYALELLLLPIHIPFIPEEKIAPPDTIAPPPRIRTLQRYQVTVYFQFDSDELELNELEKLQDFAASLAGKETQHVDINGYADDIGEDGYNLKLSEKRAKKIALFLMQKGFPISRIAMKGNGEIHDGQAKSQNRRVELKITTLE